jgi:chemotaxis response regulator CheB
MDDINNILSKIKVQETQEHSILQRNEVYVRQSDNTVYIVSSNRVIVPIIL